ncbi:MAG: hypothetical protein V1647_06140 [Pseudomonadota bacterium]
MKKISLSMLVLFGTILTSCGGLPGLTLLPEIGTYTPENPGTYGDPNTLYVVVSNAPEGSIVHYNVTYDGTTAPDCYCLTGSPIYSSETDIPIYVGTTSVNAVACDENGVPVSTRGATTVTITAPI